jgi:hypothetical protein
LIRVPLNLRRLLDLSGVLSLFRVQPSTDAAESGRDDAT